MPNYAALGTISATGIQSTWPYNIHIKPACFGTRIPKMEYEGQDKKDLVLLYQF